MAPRLRPSGGAVFGAAGHRARAAAELDGVRVEQTEDPLMQQIRYLDKLVDEMARGKAMTKILRA